MPPTPWYHSGLITAHRGVVPIRVRKNSKNHNLITTVRSSMYWRTKRSDGHFSDNVEEMKAIIVRRSNRKATSRGFAVFCDDLYRDSDMTVEFFWPNIKKQVHDYETAGSSLMFIGPCIILIVE